MKIGPEDISVALKSKIKELREVENSHYESFLIKEEALRRRGLLESIVEALR